MDFGTFYQYRAGSLAPVVEPADQEVRLGVADSFLFVDGRVRSIERHLERFTRGIELTAPEYLSELPRFFASALALIPREGRWWPRFELHLGAVAGEQLYLRLRAAPEQLGAATLWTLPESDPRNNPVVKGPDLSLGMQLRRKAQMNGADEAVLLNDSGFIAEGALSSIVWWEGDVLCAPTPEIPWLPSVTRDIVLELAVQAGYSVRLKNAKPADLVGREVWLLGAIQGIRPVTNWIDLGGPLGKPVHFEAFNRRLRFLFATLDS